MVLAGSQAAHSGAPYKAQVRPLAGSAHCDGRRIGCRAHIGPTQPHAGLCGDTSKRRFEIIDRIVLGSGRHLGL